MGFVNKLMTEAWAESSHSNIQLHPCMPEGLEVLPYSTLDELAKRRGRAIRDKYPTQDKHPTQAGSFGGSKSYLMYI